MIPALVIFAVTYLLMLALPKEPLGGAVQCGGVHGTGTAGRV